jgi:hypothetical protein
MSLSWAAVAVSPMANAPKNFSAVGPGPSGRGVHPDRAMTATSSSPEAADTADVFEIFDANVVFVAIVTDVKNCGSHSRADTPRQNCYGEACTRM